tara:strand:- start:228 stop:521 length:294 start_codon:yes stop_codon:yes gene_type:complete
MIKPILKLLMPKLDEKVEKLKSDLLEHLFGKSKRMKVVLDYINKPNKNDKDIAKLKKQVKGLEGIAHPPFFTSEEKANMLERLENLEKNKADKNIVA